MDADATWAVLTLAVGSIALAFSVLLWYLRYFCETLREAESRSREHYKALSGSPRVFGILVGAGFIVIATVLSASVLWHAVAANVVKLPFFGSGFWLVTLCIVAPVAGAILTVIVAVSEIGWSHGLYRASVGLISFGERNPLDLASAVRNVPREVKGSRSADFPVDRASAADWQASLDWVRTNEGRWQLGRGFLESNEAILVGITDQCWHNRQKGVDVFARLEEDVRSELEAALTELEATEALILNRPLQIARAGCALYLSKCVQK